MRLKVGVRFVSPDVKPNIPEVSCFPPRPHPSWTQRCGNRLRAEWGRPVSASAPAQQQRGLWRCGGLCASQCVGPSGPGASFHYQGHIPEILWGLGTYYRRIKAPKENTHFEAETWIFHFHNWSLGLPILGVLAEGGCWTKCLYGSPVARGQRRAGTRPGLQGCPQGPLEVMWSIPLPLACLVSSQARGTGVSSEC